MRLDHAPTAALKAPKHLSMKNDKRGQTAACIYALSRGTQVEQIGIRIRGCHLDSGGFNTHTLKLSENPAIGFIGVNSQPPSCYRGGLEADSDNHSVRILGFLEQVLSRRTAKPVKPVPLLSKEGAPQDPPSFLDRVLAPVCFGVLELNRTQCRRKRPHMTWTFCVSKVLGISVAGNGHEDCFLFVCHGIFGAGAFRVTFWHCVACLTP